MLTAWLPRLRLARAVSAARRLHVGIGLESTYDDSAAAVVDGAGRVISDVRLSQDHTRTGGVVPTTAGHLHRQNIPHVWARALEAAGRKLNDMDVVGVAVGPGLAPSLRQGLEFMQQLAPQLQPHQRLVAVHHMEAHALTPRLCDPAVQLPYLVLLASGGHCLAVLAESLGRYRRLGTTNDDAPGEVLDKVARALQCPGGGAGLEKMAGQGDPEAYKISVPLEHERSCRFSFSGIKVQALKLVERGAVVSDADRANMAAAVQSAVINHISKRLERAILFCTRHERIKLQSVVIAGGVGANAALRQKVQELASFYQLHASFPPPNLCVDNGAMIAWTAMEYLLADVAPTALSDVPAAASSFVLRASDAAQLSFVPKWPLGRDDGDLVARQRIAVHSEAQKQRQGLLRLYGAA